MKSIIRLLPLLSFLLMATLLMNCKKDDPTPLTDQQQATKQIAVTWSVTQVLSAPVSGAEGTLENLVLTFVATENLEPTNFTATGAPDIFLTNANSTWSWESTGSTTKVLVSNVSPVQEFTIEELTETSLTINFSFAGPVVGKINGVGEYRVSLMRQ